MTTDPTKTAAKAAIDPPVGSRDWARLLIKVFGTERGLEFIGRNLTLLQAAADDANRLFSPKGNI